MRNAHIQIILCIVLIKASAFFRTRRFYNKGPDKTVWPARDQEKMWMRSHVRPTKAQSNVWMYSHVRRVRSQAKVWRRSYVGQEVPSKRVHGRSRVTSEVSGKGVKLESWTISENFVNLWMRSHVRLRRFQSKIESAIMCDQRTHSQKHACTTICDQRKCRKSVNTQSCVTSKDAVKRVYSKL